MLLISILPMAILLSAVTTPTSAGYPFALTMSVTQSASGFNVVIDGIPTSTTPISQTSTVTDLAGLQASMVNAETATAVPNNYNYVSGYTVTYTDAAGTVHPAFQSTSSNTVDADFQTGTGQTFTQISTATTTTTTTSTTTTSTTTTAGTTTTAATTTAGTTTVGQTNSGGTGTSAGGQTTIKSCFPADSTVETTKGRMSMADLYKLSGREEIEILTAGGQFSPVAFWLHAEPHKSAEFLRLTNTNGQSISLTRGHLVFKTDCDRVERQTVRAEKISPGDCLMVDTGDGHLQAQQVLKVDKFASVGVFSPVTVSGDLLVDNILASCYSEVEAVQLQSIMFGYVDTVKSAAKQLLPDNFYSTIFGTQKNFSPIGEAFCQLSFLSQKLIA